MARPSERERRKQRGRDEAQTYADEGKLHDLEARAFADDVLAILSGEQPTGLAESEAERLAAIIGYLRTLVIENLRQFRQYPQIQMQNMERTRLAQEAFVMLRDIGRARRHHVHKFFRGASHRLKSKGPTTKEAGIECRLIACVETLKEFGRDIGVTKPMAIRMIMKRPKLAEMINSDRDFENFYKHLKDNPEYASLVSDFRDLMGFAGVNSMEGAMDWAEKSLHFATAPLSFDDATTIRDMGLVGHRADGAKFLMAPNPIQFPQLPDRPANEAPEQAKAKR